MGPELDSLLPQVQGPKERLEKGCYPIFVEGPACSRSGGVSCRCMLWPDWGSSLDLNPRLQAYKAAYKQEGNMIRFVFQEDYPGSHCEAGAEGPRLAAERQLRWGGVGWGVVRLDSTTISR